MLIKADIHQRSRTNAHGYVHEKAGTFIKINKPNHPSVIMEEYTILGRIGEGAHGIVMKARHRKTGSIVALKKVLLKRLEDGLPETALREIKALQVFPNKGRS